MSRAGSTQSEWQPTMDQDCTIVPSSLSVYLSVHRVRRLIDHRYRLLLIRLLRLDHWSTRHSTVVVVVVVVVVPCIVGLVPVPVLVLAA
jgi:hypothetical protein